MVHLSPEDFHRCNESLELDDVCSSLVDILHDILCHIEGDSFCVISCMLRMKIREINSASLVYEQARADTEGTLLSAIFPIPR